MNKNQQNNVCLSRSASSIPVSVLWCLVMLRFARFIIYHQFTYAWITNNRSRVYSLSTIQEILHYDYPIYWLSTIVNIEIANLLSISLHVLPSKIEMLSNTLLISNYCEAKFAILMQMQQKLDSHKYRIFFIFIFIRSILDKMNNI